MGWVYLDKLKRKIEYMHCFRGKVVNTPMVKYYSLRPIKIAPLFYFRPSHKVCPILLFIIFGSGPHIPLTHSYPHFIIKLYKRRTYIPLTFSTHFSLHFLKLVPGQSETIFVGQREYFIRPIKICAFKMIKELMHNW